MSVFENLNFIRAQVIYQFAILIGDYGINLNQVSCNPDDLIVV